MLKRLTSTLIQSRGIKHTVNIKWVKPPYIPSYKPERSGDLEGLPKIPENALGRAYGQCKEIKDASEAVKKIFSVGHLGAKEYKALVKQELVARVRRHKYDGNTVETRIASLTGHIRCLQNQLEQFPRHVTAKQICQELIDKRKKWLKFLRQYDYKKFEWLIEKLNIEYKGDPESYNKLTRKESLRKLTDMHCEDIRNNKLNDYRNLLESQQGPFLTEKLNALKFIRSEQVDLQLPVTVSEQDLKKVEQQLADWKIKDEIKQKSKKKKRTLIVDVIEEE